MANTDDVIREHYSRQAETHGLSPASTMLDATTRAKETELVLAVAAFLEQDGGRFARILDIGCGNGYLLAQLRAKFPHVTLVGVDFSSDMVALARQREIPDCTVHRGDVRRLDFDDGQFDLVVSERCLINLMAREEQFAALDEVRRVLAPGGRAILVEAFADGLENLNKARREMGLAENQVPFHNFWFDKEEFLDRTRRKFEVLEPCDLSPELPGANFLSSHYFMSRVVYPAVTKADIVYNSEFVRFFAFLPPMGNYAPIQAYVIQKR